MKLHKARMRRVRLATIIGSLVVSSLIWIGCGGGGGGGNPVSGGSSGSVTVPADQAAVQVRSASGVLNVASLKPSTISTLTVNTSFGSSNVSAGGSFSVPVNKLTSQLMFAQDAQSNLIAACINPGGTSAPSISEASTATVLVVLTSGLAEVDPSAMSAITSLVGGLPETGAVQTIISSQLSSAGKLNFADSTLAHAVSVAAQAAIAAQTTRSAGKLTVKGRGVLPTTLQSGVLVKPLDDSNSAAISLDVQNFGVRFVDLWAQPVDSAGNPVGSEQYMGLTSAADTSSLGDIVGSLFTGQEYGYADSPVTVSIPAAASASLLNVWGPGALNPTAVSTAAFINHAAVSTTATVVFNLAAPTIDLLLGAKALSSGISTSAAELSAIETFAQLNSVRTIASEAISDPYRASYDMAKFLITDPAGQSFLLAQAGRVGISGLTAAVLGRIAPWTILIGIADSLISLNTSLNTWETADLMDTFTITSGQTHNGVPFQVTLSWDQADDIDLHTFAPDGEHSWYGNKSITAGSLDFDNTTGFGPENFTATVPAAGIYRIAINYYNGTPPTNARVRVVTKTATRNFGPYTLSVADGNGDYPVTGTTASWWRPCDIRVNADGSVDVLTPDTSISLNRGAMARTAAKDLKYSTRHLNAPGK